MSDKNLWMVRAGEGGHLFEEFLQRGVVAIGWAAAGDVTPLQRREQVQAAVERAYPEARRPQVAAWSGQIYRFLREIAVGDDVLTYDSADRLYALGRIESACAYEADDALGGYRHRRRVRWLGKIERDRLSVAARNSLGAISTLFLVPPEVAAELRALAVPGGAASTLAPAAIANDAALGNPQVDDLYRDIQAKGFEFTKDKVSALGWEEMQELVAGLLRAMGYKTRVSPSGSDRGKDIVASPDGLGFEDPRIVVEVKHRNPAMGAPELRSFLGGRRDHDKGLYVSTGGFTREARYEAERARIPVTLMDIDDLVRALLEHYERLDLDTQRLLPLRRLYWPT